ncbi:MULTISPECIES: hypothetical protein [unclassified Mycolicibacterium]|uniref:Uncharacterized protein n=1 Tax=Mycolicibacterium sp. CBMA 213 TaxID=1968788 RepID=A0A1S6GKN3_9MYCO|nr:MULTISPECIES: hypothetical protein [unclassified Mycolicibacterium]AQS22425.1 hypothetical protein pCBMA213_2_00061 [Mycolicibacterium sp. CBMA 213]
MRQVEGALGRAHALFGDPPDAAGVAALGASNNLAEAGGGVRAGQVKMAGLSGAMPQSYHNFATDAAPALDAAAGSDQKLSDQLHDAARSDRTGRSTSGDVLTGASSDTNAIAPTTGTPAGKIALVRALRARIAQQDEVVKAYQARDARLAAMLRSTMNGRGRRGGGMPMGSMPFGGLGGGSGSGGGGSMLGSGMGPLTQLAGNFSRMGSNPRTAELSGLAGPSGPVGTPLGALTVNSSPREVAAAIMHEAHRRGYSRQQTEVILADALCESNLNPKAIGGGGAWHSIFQQDTSYSGRDNPNLNIAEYFNRLDKHGGPGSPDIAKSIFWLQQRPGEPSAAAAFAHGRQAYESEFLRQLPRARTLFASIAG